MNISFLVFFFKRVMWNMEEEGNGGGADAADGIIP